MPDLQRGRDRRFGRDGGDGDRAEAARPRCDLVPAADGHVHNDHFDVLSEGKLADLQPVGPAEGSELEVKLVELGLHDAAAGVGKVAEADVVVDVVVANSARSSLPT